MNGESVDESVRRHGLLSRYKVRRDDKITLSALFCEESDQVVGREAMTGRHIESNVYIREMVSSRCCTWRNIFSTGMT